MNKDFTTPDLCDEYVIDVQVSLGTYQSYGAIHKFYGKVETVLCPDDNSMVKEILAEQGDNRVLIINAQGIRHVSMIGDQIASKAATNGWSGIIVNGYIRDIEVLKTIPIGIFAKGPIPRKTEKRGLGEKSVEIYFDGVDIKPGMWVYADSNGWIVSKKELIL